MLADEPHSLTSSAVNRCQRDCLRMHQWLDAYQLRCVLSACGSQKLVARARVLQAIVSVQGGDGSRTDGCPGLRISNRGAARGAEHACSEIKRQPHARDASPQ